MELYQNAVEQDKERKMKMDNERTINTLENETRITRTGVMIRDTFANIFLEQERIRL